MRAFPLHASWWRNHRKSVDCFSYHFWNKIMRKILKIGIKLKNYWKFGKKRKFQRTFPLYYLKTDPRGKSLEFLYTRSLKWVLKRSVSLKLISICWLTQHEIHRFQHVSHFIDNIICTICWRFSIENITKTNNSSDNLLSSSRLVQHNPSINGCQYKLSYQSNKCLRNSRRKQLRNEAKTEKNLNFIFCSSATSDLDSVQSLSSNFYASLCCLK